MSDEIGERILAQLGHLQQSLNTCVWLLVIIAGGSVAVLLKLWLK